MAGHMSVDDKVRMLRDMGFEEARSRALFRATPSMTVEMALGQLTGDVVIPPPAGGGGGGGGGVVMGGGRGGVGNPGTGAMDETDDDMAKAIAASLQSVGSVYDGTANDPRLTGHDPPNPHDRERHEDTPVGLKNVGNTCYVNGLLQAYFMLPGFRLNLFCVEIFTKDLVGPNDPREVIVELQKLFAFLAYSKRKYVDPTPFVSSLADVKVGEQQDPTEFNMMLMEKLGRALTYDPDSKAESLASSTSGNLLSGLFASTAVQVVTATEADGTAVENREPIALSQVELALEDADHVIAGLQAYTAPSLIEGYETPKGHKTTAQKVVLFERLAPVLTLQVQRVVYSQLQGTVAKNNAPFRFDDVVYMDAFLERNQGLVAQVKAKREQLQARLDELRAEVAKFTDYNGTGCSVVPSLDTTMSLISALAGRDSDAAAAESAPDEPRVSSEEAASMLSVLKMLRAHANAQLAHLHTQMDQIRSQLGSLEDMLRKHPYQLHAVMVHSGAATVGHYWAYIHNPNTDQWTKYNDKEVGVVTKDEVWDRSIGGEGHASAYCFIYVAQDGLQGANFDVTVGVPESLLAMVVGDNAAFEQEIYDWDHDPEVVNCERFRDEFTAAWDDIEAACVVHQEQYKADALSVFNDPRTVSYAHFLFEAIGRKDMARFEVAQQVYQRVFDRDLRSHIPPPSKRMRTLEAMCGDVKLTLPSTEYTMFDLKRREYANFLTDTGVLVHCMRQALDKRWMDAAAALVEFVRVEKIHQTCSGARRTQEVHAIAGIVFGAWSTMVLTSLSRNEIAGLIAGQKVLHSALSVGDIDSPWWPRVRDDWFAGLSAVDPHNQYTEAHGHISAMLDTATARGDGLDRPQIPHCSDVRQAYEEVKMLFHAQSAQSAQ